jgi:hypothetical protein
MEPVEDFMRKFFRARIAEEKRILASGAPFRQKFYTVDCQSDSRAGTLEMLQSEEIIGVSGSDLEPTIITVATVTFCPPIPQTHRLRYHLKAVSDSWLIWQVESECRYCGGHGDERCIFCKGKHWV